MAKSPRYTPEHAAAGLDAKFPEIETWPNQFPGYEIVVDDPEFTSVCPKTGLPDFGVLTIRYMPDKHCLELKSLKEYLQCYRNLGIFQENIVNQVLEDVVKWAKPVWAEVRGEFRPRGGISTTIVAKWPRPKTRLTVDVAVGSTRLRTLPVAGFASICGRLAPDSTRPDLVGTLQAAARTARSCRRTRRRRRDGLSSALIPRRSSTMSLTRGAGT